jgi:hypothetical protein
MTPREALFVAFIRDGMRRAYRAAERVELERGTWVSVMLADNRGQLDRADPDDLPEVQFLFQSGDYFGDTKLPVEASFGQMLEAVDRMVGDDEKLVAEDRLSSAKST